MKAIRLRTEYLKNPMGIDITAPRLFWNCENGIRQTAYRIIAKNDSGKTLWDSGKTESNSMWAQWDGSHLSSRTCVFWKVCLWDENNKQGEWSEEAKFEMSLLSAADWKAKWICGKYRVKKKLRYPVDCFRKKFSVGEIKKARLYATACGLYHARLNGKAVGDIVLAPGHTDYRKRVQVQTYDVTSLVNKGENTLSIQLADGWYRGSCGAWGIRNQYGAQTKLLAQLELTMQDGTMTTIATDGTWEWSNDGPIRFADNQDGEIVDARMSPTYSGFAEIAEHSVIPSASNNTPIIEHEHLAAKIIKTPAGKTVLDFGQNIAGYVSFSLHADEGQTICMRFGEMLDGNGEFTQKNIQMSNKKKTTPLQQVEYICKAGKNDYKTTFAIFGFQYVLVETDISFTAKDFTAIAVSSDMERTGWFESSNPMLDKFVENTVWSTRNNHADLPTDCPTRERHGWAGDAQLFCPTACFLFDYAALARKYQKDLCDGQHKNGCFPQIVPQGGIDNYMKVMDGSAGWSDAGILIPWDIYAAYGDRKILADNYDAMCRYARYKINSLGKRYFTSRSTGIERRYRKSISNYGQSYGEWAEPSDVKPFSISEFVCPHPEETTAYIVFVLEHMVKIALILGKEEDAKEFDAAAQRARIGYQHLVMTEKYSLDTDRQAKLVRPLYMNLLDEEQKAYARKRLLQALENYRWRLGTGFLSTPLILDVLAEIDIEAAYRLLENEELPGWLCMPKQGATTIWENWEGPGASGTNTGSLDHYSKGSVCRWLFDTMCGIHADGENHFTIAPHPGGHFTYAKARYNSPCGTVESSFERTVENVKFTVIIPANCTAEIILPDHTSVKRETGTWCFESRL